MIFLLLTAGSLVYCLLVFEAVRRYRSQRPSPLSQAIPLSVLKPLAGLDDGLEQNLRSFFTQDYEPFEILMAVRTEDDPAVPLVRRLQAEFPNVPSRLLLVGEPPYANAKVWSLEKMTQAAQHDVLVMSDSDIRVQPGMLRAVASEFQDPRVGVTTCPYRAVARRSIWSRLEAVGMNTEFLSGVLVARMLEGMKFALGPTASARRQVIDDVGGWLWLSRFLAEDFVLGNTAAAKGWIVLLSSCVVEHRIGSQPMIANFRHRLRWLRSTRRSRPAGYIGQLFTNPLPLAILATPFWWPILPITAVIRAGVAWSTARRVLNDPMPASTWLLLPIQDILSMIFWAAGFFGNTILWRGRKYHLLRDGTFELVER